MPEYTFSNGYRHVTPYYHRFVTTAKGRWVNRTLLQVFVEDLHKEPLNVKRDIERGQLSLQFNGSLLSPTENLLSKINIRHRIVSNTHRHEPPVPGTGPWSNDVDKVVVYQDDEILVINKPSGIPTHGSGAYQYNSVVEIASKELVNGMKLFPCHRLDSATSGILVFLKNHQSVNKYTQLLQFSKSKHYLALVDGEFPQGKISWRQPVFNINSINGSIQQAKALPVDSTTCFNCLWYNPSINKSLVLCKPITGKTHQIRIHLRNLGHPIDDDFRYNSNAGLNDGVTKLVNDIELSIYGSIKNYLADKTQTKTINIYDLPKWPIFHEYIEILKTRKKKQLENMKENESRICSECKESYIYITDTEIKSGSVHLHAYSNVVDGKTFTTPIPDWAGDIDADDINKAISEL